MTQIYDIYYCFSVPSVRLLNVSLLVSFQVIVDDITALILTGMHHLEDGGKASVQSREVWFRQEGGHASQRILSQRLPQDITQAEAREAQEAQAEEGGATNPTRGMESEITKR